MVLFESLELLMKRFEAALKSVARGGFPAFLKDLFFEGQLGQGGACDGHGGEIKEISRDELVERVAGWDGNGGWNVVDAARLTFRIQAL